MRQWYGFRAIGGAFGAAAALLLLAVPGLAAAEKHGSALEYIPQAIGEARGGDNGGLGFLLIGAAIAIAVVIVVFVIRHHRSGRAG